MSPANGVLMIKQIAYITNIHLDEPLPIDHGIDARMNWRRILKWFRQCLKSSKSLVFLIHHPILAIDTAVDKKFPLQGRDRIVSEL